MADTPRYKSVKGVVSNLVNSLEDERDAWRLQCLALQRTMRWIATVEGLGPVDDRIRAAQLAITDFDRSSVSASPTQET